MAEHSNIEWTDATWQPITGCSVTSPGCTNCYAMRLAGTRLRHHPSRARLTRDTKAGPVWTGEVRLNEEWLTQPLRWKRPRRIFVCAHGDLFHENVPDEWIDRVFAVMALAPQHTFQLLTKRSARMREYCDGYSGAVRIERLLNDVKPNHLWNGNVAQAADILNSGRPLPNVWLGVSCEDQTRADQRIPDLVATPAPVRFVSAEPLLGDINLLPYLEPQEVHGVDMTREVGSRVGACIGVTPALDWVIVGGESGPRRRPMALAWARSIRDQCAAAGVAFFGKQDDGVRPLPPDLMVRQTPGEEAL